MARRQPASNLPAELSSFVGRRRELSEVRRWLSSARLVTLLGFGGVGKSRLALRVAADARRSFADGVWLVELAGLQDHSLVPHAVSGALGISDQLVGEGIPVLAGYLADRQLLLVLDNCEHMIEACAMLVAELLRAAPGLRVLATSREVLEVPGEQVYPVPPLAVPDLERSTTAAVAEFPAMMLLAERATAAAPGFAVTDDNAELMARICRRLDGLPLAIELAAARLRVLSLEQLVALLDDRFALLTGGSRTALARHQTLRAAVQWSYDLCSKPERVLWARASVFVERFDLVAAERVCGGDGLPQAGVLPALTGLVDKSILTAELGDGEIRYRLLDTVREFGLDRLARPDDPDCPQAVRTITEAELRRRHRDVYLDLAERFHADWFGPRQVDWSRRMRAELANLRAALGFCLADPQQARAGVQMAGALYFFWYGCGETREGRYWLERVLTADPHPSRYRVRALAAYGRLLILLGMPAAALDPARECLRLARRFDEPFWISHALQTLGLGLTYTGDPAAGQALLEEAVARAGECGDMHPAIAFTKFALGASALYQGDAVRAAELYAESRTISAAHGDQWWLGMVLTSAIVPAMMLGDLAQARAYARESLQARRTLHDTHGAAASVHFLGLVAAVAHEYPRAARLFGAADRHWRSVGGSPFAVGQMRQIIDEYETRVRQALGDAAFDTEFRRGAELTLDKAVTYALGDQTAKRKQPARGDGGPRLTRRESEIAALVAQGLSNNRIAARLMISQRTAESHVENILTKFGFTSRSQIAAWYTEDQRRQPPSSAPPD
jgi:predicted ATPase/DNA-binding CsgD family transcriptional regulator